MARTVVFENSHNGLESRTPAPKHQATEPQTLKPKASVARTVPFASTTASSWPVPRGKDFTFRLTARAPQTPP